MKPSAKRLWTAPRGHSPGPPRLTSFVRSSTESATRDLKAAVQTRQELQKGPFQDFRIGLLHGGLDDRAKSEVMEQFRRREWDLLVTTSVVEVGVDVPNATLMVVEHAERFGLSQLHQLRGRVSRGDVAGKFFLFASPGNDEARERLRILSRTSDGFVLAEHDLRVRGAGEFSERGNTGKGSCALPIRLPTATCCDWPGATPWPWSPTMLGYRAPSTLAYAARCWLATARPSTWRRLGNKTGTGSGRMPCQSPFC